MEASLPVGQRSVSRSAHIDRRGSLKPRRSSLSPIKFQSRNISPLSNKRLEEEVGILCVSVHFSVYCMSIVCSFISLFVSLFAITNHVQCCVVVLFRLLV